MDAAPATRGRSILQHLWDDLDIAYARSKAKTCKNRHTKRGVAVGLVHAIAIMTNPYSPNIDAVQIQAEERYRDATKRQRKQRERGAA